MLKISPFPFPGHRTMEEVVETEELLEERRANPNEFAQWCRLGMLLMRAGINNPPSETTGPDSAA